MSVSIDVSQLRSLSAQLGRQPPRVRREVDATLQRAAVNLKARMREEASGSASFKGVPASIGFDVIGAVDNLAVDVGPEIGRAQGSLAFIAYEGSATSGPVFPDPQTALEDEASVLEQHLLRIAGVDL